MLDHASFEIKLNNKKHIWNSHLSSTSEWFRL